MSVNYSLGLCVVRFTTITIQRPRAYRVLAFVGSIPIYSNIRERVDQIRQIHAPKSTESRIQSSVQQGERTGKRVKEVLIAMEHYNITRERRNSVVCLWKGLSTGSDHRPHVPAVWCTLSECRCMHASHPHWTGRLRLVSWQATVFSFCDGGC